MKKRFLPIALTLSFIAGIFPVTAMAAEPMEIGVNMMDLDLRDTDSDQSDPTHGWEWDVSTRTLTLDGFKGTVNEGVRERSAAILLPEDSYVKVEGTDNVITTHSYQCSGIYCEGDLIIGGDGYLEINIDSMNGSAIYVDEGTLTVEEKVEITVDSPRHVIYIYDIGSNTTAVTVKDKASVIFPDDLDEDSVYVIVKKGANKNSISFDYREEVNKTDDTVTLLKADKVTTDTTDKDENKTTNTEATTQEPEETIAYPEYSLTVGNKNILLNGSTVYTCDTAPYITNGYTMLPLRALLVLSDPDVEIAWNSPAKTATVNYNGSTYVITASRTSMTKDGEDVTMVSPAEIENGRLFVSLRDWMTIMDIDDSMVAWDQDTRTVTLKSAQ